MKRYSNVALLILALALVFPGCSKNNEGGGKIAYQTKDYNQALKLAAEQKKPVMIVFGASW